jgi:hypothetical protein
MKTPLHDSLAHWINGSFIAFLGVVLVRVVAPALDGRLRLASMLAGQLIALAGLLVIALGVRRRVRRSTRSS